MADRRSEKQQLRRHLLYFLGVLMLTALLWLVVSLSDRRTFRVTFRVEWQGIDTARYVVKHADREVSFDIVSNGFLALNRARASRQNVLLLDARRDSVVSAEQCCRLLMRQFDFPGVHGISCRQTQLHLQLRERHSKPFCPDITALNVDFADPYAVYGSITIDPDTVWLYGSEESLAQINELTVRPTRLSHVKGNRTYTVLLDPSWLAYPDLHASTQSLRVTIPTERFIERRYTLPVMLKGAPDKLEVHLYPSQVEVTVWVAEKDIQELDPSSLYATVEYDSSIDSWPVVIAHFPSYVRIRSVVPERVSYIMITP